MHCGNRMLGTTCGGRWRHKGKYVRCNRKYPAAQAERVPILNGMLFINYGGIGVTRLDQITYDSWICKRDKYPKVTRGPRPAGWKEGIVRISDCAERELRELTKELPEC